MCTTECDRQRFILLQNWDAADQLHLQTERLLCFSFKQSEPSVSQLPDRKSVV